MDDQQKLELFDFLLANMSEVKLHDYGWMYADRRSPDELLQTLADIKYEFDNPEEEDEDSE